VTLRPLRRRLGDEAIALMDEQRANGLTPAPIHMMLVDDSGPRELGRVACDGGLGEWVTGDMEQVTCPACITQVHA
jgi:hypothetical protein